MRFALVRICGSKRDKNDYSYSSLIVQSEVGLSLTGHKTFASKDEMIATMNGILSTQTWDGDIRHVLDKIEDGCFEYAGDRALYLTDEQAESLGWPKPKQK